MSLERLVEEIRTRAERELEEEANRARLEEAEIATERDQKLQRLRDEGRRSVETEAARERTQRLASAKVQARKLVHEARERKTNEFLGEARQALADYTESAEYPQVLKRMYAVATERLGKSIRVMGRAEDASALKSVAGKAFDETPVPIVGGLIAETTDGSRRLNLSFDELLRLRESEVRALLAA
jgi:V/A-type H+-transporting ATPase subunit E